MTEEEALKANHYDGACETIKILEEIAERPIPEKAKFSIQQATRYLMRCGKKAETPWEVDAKKALNYLYRAIYGEWFFDKTPLDERIAKRKEEQKANYPLNH